MKQKKRIDNQIIVIVSMAKREVRGEEERVVIHKWGNSIYLVASRASFTFLHPLKDTLHVVVMSTLEN